MTATGTEGRVCEFIASRQQLGINKYGTTVEQNPLEYRAWLVHLKEELADALIYVARAIEVFDELEGEVDEAIEIDRRANG